MALQGPEFYRYWKKLILSHLYITAQKEMARPLSIAEGIKFVKQGFYEGDPSNYSLPNSFDVAFVGEYLRPGNDSGEKTTFQSC